MPSFGVNILSTLRISIEVDCNRMHFVCRQCVLVVLCSMHVCARYALQLYNADVAGPVAYYTHLVFDVSPINFAPLWPSLKTALYHQIDSYLFHQLLLTIVYYAFM